MVLTSHVFGSVRNPSLAREGYQAATVDTVTRMSTGVRDALIQLAGLLPIALLGLWWCFRPRLNDEESELLSGFLRA